DLLRAVTMGYDVGARICEAFGADEFSKRLTPSCMPGSFVAAAVSSALLRHDQAQVRHTLTYAAQQASGTGLWKRDREHIEKTFDYAGMGSRNGVMAATMVSAGFTAAEDPFSGDPNVFTALAEKPAPEKLLANLGTKFAVSDTSLKKWTVGGPLQTVADSMADLLKDPAVTPANVAHVTVELPAYSLSIVDNASTPDLCAQHLVAMMIVDHGATFSSIHDAARMKDPKVLAVRSLVELKGSKELDIAKPARQAIVTIQTKDGKTLTKHTVYVRGLKENPMGWDEVEAKAIDLMNPILGQARARRLVASIKGLDTLGPVAKLRLLLQALIFVLSAHEVRQLIGPQARIAGRGVAARVRSNGNLIIAA
ncbi:MAG: MmgE/PrpD family protein, partial [Gemmatimonadales bacterium]